MQIKFVRIENFKGIRNLEIDFVDRQSGKIRPITCLFGDNGSGKTTVLQALALVISLATRKINNPYEFQWYGFLGDRVSTFGKTYIEVDIVLSEDEINAIDEIYNKWKQYLPVQFKKDNLIAPKKDSCITIIYESGRIRAKQGRGALVELLGRYYTKSSLIQRDKQDKKYFDRVGDVFWFDQYRNLGRGNYQNIEGNDVDSQKISWQAGIEVLRKHLVGWEHKRRYSTNIIPEEDYLEKLQGYLSRIFIGSKFDGLEIMPSTIDQSEPEFYFMIKRNDSRYDISEMSSGEQAVFCVLYEFVRLNISRSIVLIDELELHLHPPEQQLLYNSLRKIGPDCQYIITSHSPYLRDIIPEGQTLRLEGGSLCL
ncbi:putative ATP-binding protein involved in virulence [Anaerobacterium chartisolvens]|uniref:Putative ATP-binding protein involved in virulence n=1 Tax=Anaerobacterium chartisolvens TaxID=1297424 RepID=A0A369BK46_9FIRM|nr:ATP-binding protein [Anaerobacterium chartisolvens]RCX20988.1 putative ATP-binding protein involved in virulence [Anaerobacterium chartisolvens]